ncbi:MAG TPA: hypothetical protein VE398_20445 [Acidobacteriota bacterium]|nr:hypothetical protein [Acidobacteriota bacterium]
MNQWVSSRNQHLNIRSPGHLPEGFGCNTAARYFTILMICSALAMSARAEQDKVRTEFVVKYVSADAVYLEGGSSTGLAAGQKLTIKHKGADGIAEGDPVAEIEIDSVATSSAVGKIVSSNGTVAAGDVAFLSAEDVEKLKVLLSSQDARKYPQIISFNEGDPLDEEVRENLPKPPLPEVNRTRGRVGIDYSNLRQGNGATGSSQFGFMLRIDSTRIGGSYWNLTGYYRGRLSQTGRTQDTTLVDLINRTYHLGFYYDNPNSHWVAGIGRLYIPWASSLSTIDGFYLGRHYGKATVGVFGGSTPDPTSWNYNPHREMAGGFVNFEGGNYDGFHFTSTSGIAVTRIRWRPDRQFGFFENGISYKRYLSIYSDIECDLLGNSQNAANANSNGSPADTGFQGVALSRSFLTVRLQPFRILSFDVSENYFRNIPTFDTRLIGTGLLDNYLFQGLSGGFRLELPYRTGIYGSLGKSSRTGDTRASWDYMAGFTAGNIMHTGVRADFRYSKFDSSFGQGTYRSLSLTREIGEGLRFDLQAGLQNLISAYTSQGRTRFLNGTLDWFLGYHYLVGLGFTTYRGGSQDYDQYFLTMGYRFDNRRHGKNNGQLFH